MGEKQFTIEYDGHRYFVVVDNENERVIDLEEFL